MSLRVRIPILFIGFAFLPVLLLGLGDYLQSVQALRVVIDVRRDALAAQTARDLERTYLSARQALAETAADGASRMDASSSVAGSPFPFDSIRIAPAISAPTASVEADRDPGVGAGCEGPAKPLVIRFQEGDGQVVEGYVAAGTLMDRVPMLGSRVGHGYTRILQDSTDTVLFDSGCIEASSGGAGSVPTSEDADDFDDWVDTDVAWQRSVAGVANTDWTVAVYTNDEEFLVPFQQSRLLYVVLVLFILTIAAAIFSLLIRGSLGSLPALIRAADEVEVGNMRPWLPPPGDDDVGRLAMAFRKMTDRLDESMRQSRLNQKLAAVGELASYLSHEIRNPLSSIRLGLQTLHRDLSAGFIPPDADRIIEISMNEVKRLDGVVRTVLEVGRDPGQIDENSTCDVHETIVGAVDVITPKARSRGVQIEVEPGADPARVFGDPEALRGVWLNLLVNALDALDGQDDGRIVIFTRLAGDEELHVRVADNGPGVPPFAAGSIFEPFYTTKNEGNGIGLATASATLQAAGGSITYDERASVNGAVFRIRLRLAKPADDADPDSDALEPTNAAPAAGAA